MADLSECIRHILTPEASEEAIAKAIQTLIDKGAKSVYSAILDENICEVCNPLDNKEMTLEEIMSTLENIMNKKRGCIWQI